MQRDNGKEILIFIAGKAHDQSCFALLLYLPRTGMQKAVKGVSAFCFIKRELIGLASQRETSAVNTVRREQDRQAVRGAAFGGIRL